jgi:ferredoxin
MRPIIDTGMCSGHGRCYTVAPDIFDCDDEGFPVVLRDEVTRPELERELREAMANCPERAISAKAGA